MAANVFHLEILATDKPFYRGDCDQLIYPSIDGLIGILPNHEPMVTAVAAGEIKYQVNGEWNYAACGEGFLEVINNRVRLFADSVEKPEEIDVKRAEAARERAEERLRQKESMREYYHTQAALNKAMNRLKVSSKHFHD